ncbi:small ribosomal subunit protein mS35-like [Babylonia areolata]|uniref:small ribosomal subunit protein mS35-like n=1 Tax=Babylonia areolata TaxID=304850 RepID=UPI003FD0961A
MEGMANVRSLCFTHLKFLRTAVDFNLHRRSFHHGSAILQRRRQETALAEVEEEFRTYEVPGLKPRTSFRRFQRRKRVTQPPRYKQMATDQDWTNVWPAATSFKWSVVPFPVRQGFVETVTENDGVIPSKYANAELMKIPNFLHLTPDHVKKHCAALKHLCTEWPAGLETDEDCQKHFPMEVESSDYVFSSPSIRDPRARTVTVKLRLSDLELDYHAKDKFIRLVGDCYKPDTGELVFVSEKCPLKKQNFDYVMYLLTAIYHESWKREAWEAEKTEADMEKFFWDISTSKKTMIDLLQTTKKIDQTSGAPEDQKLQHLPEDPSEESLLAVKEVQDYGQAVSDMMNDGETPDTLQKYGQAVRTLLGIKGGLGDMSSAATTSSPSSSS